MTDENKAIGSRIRQARIALGLTQQALADKLSITVQSVSQWETGRTRPNYDRIWLLEEVLGTPGGWLAYGEGDMTLDPPKKHDGYEEFRNRLAPLLDWNEKLAGYGQRGLESVPYDLDDGALLATYDAHRDLFALKIEDIANSPLFEIGDIVIGDTGAGVAPGDMVFAKLHNRKDVIFRQIKAFRRNDADALIADLRPINGDYELETINLTDDYDRIIGVMVEHRRFRRR
ncbi:helix-turn-helix domain-containing protein [Xanthobacter sediminis]